VVCRKGQGAFAVLFVNLRTAIASRVPSAIRAVIIDVLLELVTSADNNMSSAHIEKLAFRGHGG
jgi:hypothetical protein